MPIKNLHGKPFDAGTLTKLDIFQKYLEAWLPVFIHSPKINAVNICDFFAGTGQDVTGAPGSPLIILDVISRYQDQIFESKLSINVLLNEFDPEKYESLIKSVENYREKIKNIEHLVDIRYDNEDFEKLFLALKGKLRNACNLLFLDQNGVRHMTKARLREIDTFTMTDFLFFSSSSYLKRFQYTDYFEDLVIDKDTKQTDIHRKLLEYYRSKLPAHSVTKLFPFTLKKAGNIYGLIYGSKSYLGVDKFLSIAWGQNPINGEANFDIDNDRGPMQLNLFEPPKISKVDAFKKSLKEFIFSRKEVTNEDIYVFTLKNGFIPKFSKELLIELRNAQKIEHFAHPLLNYKKIVNERKIIKFKVNKNGNVKN